MTSRRHFLATLPVFTAAATLPARAALSHCSAEQPAAAPETRLLLETGWRFRLDPSGASDPESAVADSSAWRDVTVPHTWQTLGKFPDFVGVAWYRYDIDAPIAWQERFVRIEFEAVFHTAHVHLNGASVGQHVGKGYTAFTSDLSPALRLGEKNTLLVRVDNSYSNTMLPRMKSFDWTNDGGLIRPVSLLVTPRVFIERIEIDATPDLERKTAGVEIRAVIRNTLGTPQRGRVSALVQEERAASSPYAAEAITVNVAPHSSATVALSPIHIDSPKLWHFDSPYLYFAAAVLCVGKESHAVRDTFGIRRFESRGSRFYLNGEPVALMGLERMAGSHPEFGMAETLEWIESNHNDMKELNCVFTRVHWAQDKRVLDYCDRHGILMQEEVPAWGSFTFSDISDQLQHQLEENGVAQLREMVTRDLNHPSIVSWGLCNEVNGKNPRSRAFAHKIADEARKLDPTRLLTYASDSLGDHPETDMSGDFDFISMNEYYGSWSPGGPKEVREHLDSIRKAFPGKPIVISEYGWCECQSKIPPGDERRVEIVNDHTQVFRDFPEVAGAIYFDYNDYRTLVGDKGVGAFKQRVHGVVDLYANRKPSFQALRSQSSPIESLELTSSGSDYTLHIVSRKTFPAYTLLGYRVRWVAYGYDDLPMEGRIDELPKMAPGDALTLTASFVQGVPLRMVVDVLRPTGFSTCTIELSKLS
jgi:beta-glucuronidase